jgi:hypothetical protein
LEKIGVVNKMNTKIINAIESALGGTAVGLAGVKLAFGLRVGVSVWG